MHRIDVRQKSRYKATVLVLLGALNINVFSKSRRHIISFLWILPGHSLTMSLKSFRDFLARRGLRICSRMRLLARSESRGTVFIVEEWAAAPIFIAEGATLVPSSVLMAGVVSMEDPNALSLNLELRLVCRNRAERLPTAGDGGWSTALSMMEPYDLRVGEPSVWSRKVWGRGSASSRKDCLAVGERSSAAERPRSMSPRVKATRRLWASTTSSSVV
jgi:hypothetical protein